MLFGFIGIGNMGAPMARNILRAGEKLMVWTRTPERMLSFFAQGALKAGGPQNMADCDALCTCLPMPADVTNLVLGSGGSGLYAAMKPGSVHLEMSTIDPGTAERMEKAAAEKGIAYVQCCLGKSPAAAEAGQAPSFWAAAARRWSVSCRCSRRSACPET